MAELQLNDQKQQQRAMWAMGDFPTVAEQIAEVGRAAVEAASVSGGDTVLDVACGAGNATIPAAKTGAQATGLDITPELLEAAQAAAADAGVQIEWIEGDAEQLPFDDESFDAVTSVFGGMFAPDHRVAAAEIARVLKPGGRMAVCAWTPEGRIGKFFITMANYMPPPPEGFEPPILWGTEDHAREIFDGTGMDLEFERQAVEFQAESAEEMMDRTENKLPPVVAAKAMLEPERWQELRAKIVQLTEEENEAEDGSYRAPMEYLVIRGTKAG